MNVTGWLMYDEAASKPAAILLDEFAPFDDFTLSPQDGLELYSEVDYSFDLNLKMVQSAHISALRCTLTLLLSICRITLAMAPVSMLS